MGSIPVHDSEFFFDPRSRHVKYFIFHISLPTLRFTIFLYLSPFRLHLLKRELFIYVFFSFVDRFVAESFPNSAEMAVTFVLALLLSLSLVSGNISVY